MLQTYTDQRVFHFTSKQDTINFVAEVAVGGSVVVEIETANGWHVTDELLESISVQLFIKSSKIRVTPTGVGTSYSLDTWSVTA